MKKKLVQTSFKGIALVLSVFALTFAACNIDGIGDGDAVSLQLSRSAGNVQAGITDWSVISGYDTNGGGGYVTYGGGTFVVAHWTDGAISYSDNGLNWTVLNGTQTTFGTNFVKYIAYLNGRFWAVGQNGKIAISSDGANWTAVPQVVTDADIYSIAYGVINDVGIYVCVTDINDTSSYESQIIYSTDNGVNWDNVANHPVQDYKIDSIVYTNGNFALFTNTGYISYTNSDVRRWVPAFRVNTGAGMNTNHFKMAAVGNDLIVATSRYGYAYASTRDLAAWNWTDAYPSASYTTHVWLNCVLFDGTRFIMAGQGGAMAYTTDGATVTVDPNFDNPSLSWTKGDYAKYYINGIAYDPNFDLYVASGGDSIAIGEYTRGFSKAK
jgi:hypothetical protein